MLPLYGQCALCGGSLTIWHLENECPLRPQQELSEEDKAKIRFIAQTAFNKLRSNKVIKPTIGRVVWFWLNNEACYAENAQPNAALVTFVHNDDTVNLVVFDRNGDGQARTVVHLWQGEGPRPSGPHCEWMPYQKGQAAKQESESKVDFAQYFARLDAVEKELASIRQVAEYIKQLPKGAVSPPATNAAVPPPPLKTSNSTGEDPSKNGTGVG